MKFLATLSLICVLMGLAQGQSDIICSLEALPVGTCVNRIVGYTYSRFRDRCTNYETRGCEVRGNYFANRDVCEAKCKRQLTFREAPFSFFVERAFNQARNILSRILNFSLFSN
ncbi:uncharacterized protein LOC108134756 [Drosophila elegans]|uniref:uncharacterized protein LOC108134756 n=1 Tax=Drosophila elegans TaxID=30023 RepID=UPI0007E7B1C4|nr:uncharacterized protein LOC108134756 [Drosophila elegans]